MPRSERLSVWMVRGLLALLLLLAVEILFWNKPGSRSLYEWPLLIVGYMLLATVALDLLVRYRIRDIWGVMIVVGVLSALNGLFLNPQSALEDVPNTLLSRTLGGYWLISLEMVGLFLALLGGKSTLHKVLMLIGSVVIGFFWAVWVKWYPAFFLGAYRAATIQEMFQTLAWVVLPIIILWVLVRGRAQTSTPEHFQVPWLGYAVIGLLAMLLFIYHALQNHYDGLGIALSLIIVGVLWAMLWFRADTQKTSLLATYLAEKSPSPLWLIASLALFVAVTIGGYVLALIEVLGFNQFTLLNLAFPLFGAGWIPLVAAVIGIHAMTRQMRLRGF